MTNVTAEQIRNSMEKGITFEPSVDLRKDLIAFYDYTMETVLNMSDDEVYDFFDRLEYGIDEEEESTYPIQCYKCKHDGLKCVGYDDSADISNHYKMECPKCKDITHIHECSMDSIMEYAEFKKQLCNEIKEVVKTSGAWHFFRSYKRNDFNIKEYTNGWEFIQEIEVDTVYYFYKNMGVYMKIEESIHGYEVCMINTQK